MNQIQRRRIILIFLLAMAILALVFIARNFQAERQAIPDQVFNGERALADALHQVELGPRTLGSDAHADFRAWLTDELEKAGWEVEVQESELQGVPIKNIIAKKGTGSEWIILGAHYDSRFWADQEKDPANQTQPVPGANDGASGVAVLTELARVIPDKIDKEIWLVFFDAEDNGGIPGYEWIMGSTAFVANLESKPQAAVIVDMIGDADLNIYQERNSDPHFTLAIWETAADLGYEGQFIPELKYSMLDDHTPFLNAGIPAVDLIDFDYPYWHTLEDTGNKISAASLKAVGDTLLAWLKPAK